MTIRTTKLAYRSMASKWVVVDDLMAGADHIRKKGKIYLPQELGESDAAYERRLARSVLYNLYKRTVQTLVGYTFSAPVTVSNAPAELEYLQYNFNGTGRSITEVAAELFKDAIHLGVSHLYVDFPKTDVNAVMNPIDFAELGLRPYCVQVNPRGVIGWRVDYNNGFNTLNEVRILEEIIEEDDYVEVLKERVRKIEPDFISVYELNVGTDDPENWELVDGYVNTLGKIPLLTTYGNYIEPMVGHPVLADLAELNLAHYRSLSDQINILHIARVPILVAAGFADDADEITISANTLITSTNDKASLKYTEINGQSVSSGRQLNADLEGYMSRTGADIIYTKSVARQTATGRQVDQAESLSVIQIIIKSLEQTLESAYKLAGEWLGLNDVDVSVTIGSDLSLVNDPNPVTSLLSLQELVQLDDETLLEELKRRGILAAHVNPENISVTKPEAPLVQAEANAQETPEDSDVEQTQTTDEV